MVRLYKASQYTRKTNSDDGKRIRQAALSSVNILQSQALQVV